MLEIRVGNIHGSSLLSEQLHLDEHPGEKRRKHGHGGSSDVHEAVTRGVFQSDRKSNVMSIDLCKNI